MHQTIRLYPSLNRRCSSICMTVDPTAGPEGDTHAAWYMDQRILHENIKKTLVRFCVPSPVVYR